MPDFSSACRFHLALPVADLDVARRFFVDVMACAEGRSDDRWIDFDFFGHQVSVHQADELSFAPHHNLVDGERVPVPHFGMVLPLDDWHTLRERFETKAVTFVLPPQVRFEGQPGEQHTMFVQSPFGYVLEFKGFQSLDALFAN